EVSHAEFFGKLLTLRVDVDADDHVRANQARTLDHVETDAAQAEYDDVRTGLDLRSADDGANARGHTAADVADLIEGGVLADFRDRNLRQHGEVREGRATHVVVDDVLTDREAARAVWH